MLRVRASRTRAKQLVESFHASGRELGPTVPEGWSDDDCLSAAGLLMASLLWRRNTPYSFGDARTLEQQEQAIGNMFAALRFHIAVFVTSRPDWHGANVFELFSDIEIPSVDIDANYESDGPAGPVTSAN